MGARRAASVSSAISLAKRNTTRCDQLADRADFKMMRCATVSSSKRRLSFPRMHKTRRRRARARARRWRRRGKTQSTCALLTLHGDPSCRLRCRDTRSLPLHHGTVLRMHSNINYRRRGSDGTLSLRPMTLPIDAGAAAAAGCSLLLARSLTRQLKKLAPPNPHRHQVHPEK